MNKIAFLFALLGVAAVSAASTELINLGTEGGNFLLGTCLAMQEDTTDTTTDCYKSCLISKTALITMFNTDQYNNKIFNMGDFNNFGNIFLIKLMTQFSKCTYVDFLLAADQRLSSWSFLGGAVTKLAVQLY